MELDVRISRQGYLQLWTANLRCKFNEGMSAHMSSHSQKPSGLKTGLHIGLSGVDITNFRLK
jgi:hypothetical protein